MVKRPLIGLTPHINQEETRLSVNRFFGEALLDAGALPVILPLTSDPAALGALVEAMDGFIFTGGGDIDPRLFGQATRDVCGVISPLRDAMELPLAAMLHDRPDKPVMGVCRGMQAMCVALGGTVYQDIAADCGHIALAHRQKQPEQYPSHEVKVETDTLLHRLTGQDVLPVNSLHHQAVATVPPVMRRCAAAPDGIVEAVESRRHPFYLGVQWHPERLWEKDAASRSLFGALVQACRAL